VRDRPIHIDSELPPFMWPEVLLASGYLLNRTPRQRHGSKTPILDELSMVSLEALAKISKQCDAIWDLNRSSNTVFGGTPIAIFLGDFNQFQPVDGCEIWSQKVLDTRALKRAKAICGYFTKVIFLIVRYSLGLPYGSKLRREDGH
jgi:hypothetical protein